MGYAGICINVKVMLNSGKRLTRTLGHGVTLHSLSKNNKKNRDYELQDKVKNRRFLTDDAGDGKDPATL